MCACCVSTYGLCMLAGVYVCVYTRTGSPGRLVLPGEPAPLLSAPLPFYSPPSTTHLPLAVRSITALIRSPVVVRGLIDTLLLGHVLMMLVLMMRILVAAACWLSVTAVHEPRFIVATTSAPAINIPIEVYICKGFT